MKKILIFCSLSLTVFFSSATVYLLLNRDSTPDFAEETSAEGYVPFVMTYHLINDETYGGNEYLFVRPSEFEEQLKFFSERGYEYLFAGEWRLTDKPSVIITFDDGYSDNYTEMYRILTEYSAKATVFLITDLIDADGYLTSEQIEYMSESGLVSFECHTASHSRLTSLTPAELRADFTESVDKIKKLTGKSVTALAYPYGAYNGTVMSISSEFFDFAYTTEHPPAVTEHTQYNIPRYYISRGDGKSVLEKIFD